MALPKNILYPVDFSDRCRTVWPAIAEMALQLRAPVTLLHVLDIDHLDLAAGQVDLDAMRAHMWDKLQHFPTPGVPSVAREVIQGSVAECIVHRAAKIEAPMIMMPTRGHTRFRQLLLGSVTAAVLHDAACPVWTEVHREDLPVALGNSVICAIDMGPRTPEVLQIAIDFSKNLGVSLHIVHSVPGVDPRFPSGAAYRAHTFLINKAREDFPIHCHKAGVDAALEIVEDVGLVDGIVATITKYSAGLLVIGRGVIQGPLGRLRTNAHELIRRSPCAVLSV